MDDLMSIFDKPEIRNGFDIYDVTGLFLSSVIGESNRSRSIPCISFKFMDSKEWLINALLKIEERERIDVRQLAKNAISVNEEALLTIEVNNTKLFFEKLFEYIIAVTELEDYYNLYEKTSASIDYRAESHLMYLWLRMGSEDVTNIDRFLDKQIQFARNRVMDYRWLDYHLTNKVGVFSDCDIYMYTEANRWWDETNRRMLFTLTKGNVKYQLPTVLYDIDDSGVCYIYGVQNKNLKRNENIEKELRSLNKGKKIRSVHPSKVLALLLFINELRKHNISKVIVPTLQVLSYPFHEITLQKTERNIGYMRMSLNSNFGKYTKEDYEEALRSLERYKDCDRISRLKTEELIYLVYRITEHDKNIEILSEIDQSDNLIVRLNSGK